jgi:hypothetical protein
LPDLNLDEKTGAVQSANMVDGWTVGMLIWKKNFWRLHQCITSFRMILLTIHAAHF